MIDRKLVFVLVFLLVFVGAKAQNKTEPRLIIHLLDYVGTDYAGAVENGEVINTFEYAEMLEFSASINQMLQKLQDEQAEKDFSEIAAMAKDLGESIDAHLDSETIALKSNTIKIAIIAATGILLSPQTWPSIAKGAALYETNCASCHGNSGQGDGLSAASLNPPPTAFTNMETMADKSPLQAFHTIKFGVEGTSMMPFYQLKDQEAWDLAFYISTLRHTQKIGYKHQLTYTLEEIATLSDNALMAKYNQKASLDEIAYWRFYGQEEKSTQKPLDFAKTEMQKVIELAAQRQFTAATNAALNAYLEGIEPVEISLKAQDPKFVQQLELEMGVLRKLLNNEADIAQITKQVHTISEQIETGIGLLANKEASFWLSFSLAASVILREGLEAFLIIIIIISVLQKAGANRAIKYVHAGWIIAVAIGLISWFFADWLMNIGGMQRELMEGLVTIFAVFILFYIGFWMHGKSEIKKWNEYIKEKINKILTKKSMLGLSAFAFIVVFREAFESVLFLSAIGLEDENQFQGAIGLGVIVAFIGVAIFAILMMRFSKKLPIAQLFKFSAIVIALLSVVLIGKGVHALQESGLISISASPIPLRLGLLGIFPTLETSLAQLFILFITWLAWRYQNKPKKNMESA